MKGISGHKPATKQRRFDRLIKRLVKQYPDVWPAAIVHGQERWQDMPADQFDWAMEEIVRRREAR